MRLSQYFLPIIKENPSEAQIVSHRLMLRAGMVRVYSGFDGAMLYQLDGRNRDDNYGMSVAGGPDFNQDGYSDLIIGASRVNGNSGADTGQVSILSGTDESVLRVYEGTYNSNLGYSVATLGDIDGNGADDFARDHFRQPFQLQLFRAIVHKVRCHNV